jgi:hypothetical protein
MDLPQREPVVVAGGEVADVQPDPGESLDLHGLPLGEEPAGDTALIEHLDGPCVQAAGPRAVAVLAGPPLEDRDVDPGQRQLARQHHPCRAAARDRHGMVGHAHFGPQLLVIRLLAASHSAT